MFSSIFVYCKIQQLLNLIDNDASKVNEYHNSKTPIPH